VFDIG